LEDGTLFYQNHVIFSTTSHLFKHSVILFIITVSTNLLGTNTGFPGLKLIGCPV